MRLAALCDDEVRLRGPGEIEIGGLALDFARGARRRPVRGHAWHTDRRQPLSSRGGGQGRRGGAGRLAARERDRAAGAGGQRSRVPLWRGWPRAFTGRSPPRSPRSPAPAARPRSPCFTRQLWAALGERAASIGTLGLQTSDAPGDGSLTTPDPITLHRMAAELAAVGTDHLAIEASSHGLDQHRARRLAAGRGRVHQPQPRPFRLSWRRWRPTTRPSGGCSPSCCRAGATAVLNADVPEFGDLAGLAVDRRLRIFDSARAGRRCGWCAGRRPPEGQELEVDCSAGAIASASASSAASRPTTLLAAAGLVLAAGALGRGGAAAPRRPAGAAGPHAARRRVIPPARAAFVDYAHKPEALAKALEALRPHTRAGSCRVRLRRRPRRRQAPADGRDRGRLADVVWSPTTTRAPRMRPRSARRCWPLLPAPRDRRPRGGDPRGASAALAHGDALLVAGKGHETYQIVGDRTLPFDDAEVLRDAARLAGGTAV